MQAKCKCQPGSVSILAGSPAQHGWGGLGSPLAEGSGKQLCLLLCLSTLQPQSLPSSSAPGACVGLLGWWCSEMESTELLVGHGRFPESLVRLGKKSPNEMGQGRVKDVLQVYTGRNLRATPADVKTPHHSRSLRKGLVQLFHYWNVTASVLLCLFQAVRRETPYCCLQQAGMWRKWARMARQSHGHSVWGKGAPRHALCRQLVLRAFAAVSIAPAGVRPW